jgi:hypothetical protein
MKHRACLVVALSIVVSALDLFAAERTVCGNNMVQLDAATQIHARKHNAGQGERIPPDTLYSYLKGATGSLKCPAGGEYAYGIVGSGPTCSVHGALSEIRKALKKEEPNKAVAAPKPSPSKRADTLPAAKALALRAASAFFLSPDPGVFQSTLAKDADWKGRGDGSATKAVDQIRRSGDKIAKQALVKEILFCVGTDIADMKQRFPAAANLWKPDRIPQRLKSETSFACILVYHRLENIGDPNYTDDELNELVVFVIDKTADGYKIVHIDDLP